MVTRRRLFSVLAVNVEEGFGGVGALQGQRLAYFKGNQLK